VDLIRRNETLFADVESTEGTSATITAPDAILASGISIEENLEIHARDYQGTPGVRPPVPGAQNGATVSFQTELKGNGTTTIPEVDVLLTGCLGSVAASNLDSTISGTSGSATVWDVLDGANASTGSLVMLETATADVYEVGGIITTVDTGATPDDVTVSPGAGSGGGAYATNGKKVKEMRTYQILLPPSSNNSVTFQRWFNADSGAGQYEQVVGARGTFKVDAPRAGAIPMFTWDFKGWSTTRATTGTRPTPSYDTTSPKSALATRFRIDGTLTDAFDISFSLNAEVALKMSQNSTTGVYGAPHISYKPSGSFKIHPAHTSVAEFTAWEAGTQRSILWQVGNTLYNTYAIFIPKAVATKVTRVDDNGVQAIQVDWVATEQDDALATASDASFYIGVG